MVPFTFDEWTNMRKDMCRDICRDMCKHMCRDMCKDMCVHMHTDIADSYVSGMAPTATWFL